jgi:Protein of unknown function (DUF4238)
LVGASELGPKPKSHHYVHRAYLEGFLDPETVKGDSGYLWAYMPGKSPFTQRPERVAKRNYYYCLNEKSGRDFKVEEGLAKLEDAALPILRSLRNRQFSLSQDERLTFAGYIALAFTRVPTFERSVNRVPNMLSAMRLEMASHDMRLMEQAARKHNEENGEGITAEEFKKKLTGGTVEITQENRGWSIKMMFEMTLTLQDVIANMSWCFFIAPQGDPGFLSTDNPVALYDPGKPRWGGISFASSPSAHFAFPISRELCLIGQHRPAPIIEKLNPSKVREVNKGNISRCDMQVYAPFKSEKVQAILDEVMREKKSTGKVFFRKGEMVQE